MPEEPVTQCDTSSLHKLLQPPQQIWSTSKNSESKRYALFTDTEFLCDETPSVSRNREVVP